MIVEEEEESGFEEERQSSFQSDTSLDAYVALYRLVLQSYGFRCALTGAQFDAPDSVLHTELDVVAIQPREHGGPLTIGNYLPMLPSLTAPFNDGLIVIEDDFRITVPRPDLLGSDMLSALRATLILPPDAMLRPGSAFLAYHRRFALGR